MSLSHTLQILFWTVFSIVAGTWIVFMYWRLRSNRIRSVDGEAPLQSSRAARWFVEEHDTGSQPCVSIRDARQREWRVKWGQEVHTEVFGTRLAWALGYSDDVGLELGQQGRARCRTRLEYRHL